LQLVLLGRGRVVGLAVLLFLVLQRLADLRDVLVGDDLLA